MYQKEKKPGFSLLELIVAMAIIAILSVITYQLISRVQLSSRDSQRQQSLQNIAAGMEQAYQSLNQYPNISFSTDGKTVTLVSSGSIPTISLGGPSVKIAFNGASNGKSNPSGTVYCQYVSQSFSTYTFGAKLEGSDNWNFVGPDTTSTGTSNCTGSTVN